MIKSNPFRCPHNPHLSWERRIAERQPFRERVTIWRIAALADGWSSHATYTNETEEYAFTMQKDGFVCLGLNRPGGKMLPEAEISLWGPDGMTINIPDPYDWETIIAGVTRCGYCGASPVETERVGFAGRACAVCGPIERAKLPPNWCE